MLIRSPGTSANLGPGFDCFGIAWDIYNEIEFIPGGESLRISGCPEEFQNEDNLAYQGYMAVMKAAGLSDNGLEIIFKETEVPVSRGLGSSAALITAGAVAANELHTLGYSKDELLSIATPVEGHPDNIAPALFGGFTASAMEGEQAVTAHFGISEKLHFTALIPDFKLSTELSRSVLPKSCSRADAVYNVAHAALVIKALESGDGALLKTAMQDKIHQPYRMALIEGIERVRELAEGCGLTAMCISGAGSTLLCISENADFSEKMSAAMAESFPGWRVRKLLPDLQGACKV